MSIQDNISTLATAVGNAIKPIKYLPAKPAADGSYELQITAGAAEWVVPSGGGGSSLPTWTAVVSDVTATGGLVLPGSLTWDGLKATYQELGFYVINTNDGTVGMSVIPTALAPSKFRPFVTLGSTTMMLCLVNDSAVGNYILSLGANCRFSLYGR